MNSVSAPWSRERLPALRAALPARSTAKTRIETKAAMSAVDVISK
jgi:hypothetical protein